MNTETLSKIIAQAKGTEKADLVIKNADIFNLTDGTTTRGDIAVCGGMIVGVGESYEGKQTVNANGMTAVPGFIDAHVHVESSMISPMGV